MSSLETDPSPFDFEDSSVKSHDLAQSEYQVLGVWLFFKLNNDTNRNAIAHTGLQSGISKIRGIIALLCVIKLPRTIWHPLHLINIRAAN